MPDRLHRILAYRRGEGGITALERPVAHDDVVRRVSQYAAGLGLLPWFDGRYLSQMLTPVMNLPEHERPARIPPFAAGEAAVHAMILAAVAAQEQPAEPEPQAA